MRQALPKRRGRPSKPYRTSWGDTIDGLRHDKRSGRWFAIGSSFAFREADERRAVQRFRQWQARQTGQAVYLPSTTDATIGYDFADADKPKQLDAINQADLWAYFREQLINRPEWVAERVGIEEVARLADLPKRGPSPTLEDLGNLYQQKADVSDKQRGQVRRFWAELENFMRAHGIETLRQLTTEAAAEYADHIKQLGHSAKYTKHYFTGVRGVLNFARKRGVHSGDCRHALDCLAVLQAPRQQKAKDPHPIDAEDFKRLHEAADKARDKAVMLVMLNLAMYPSEALALDWADIDLAKKTVVTDRNKTGVVRIGVLWDRTVEALAKIQPKQPNENTPVFISERGGLRLTTKTWSWRFKHLRKAAGVKASVKSEDFRDGAYTAAIDSGAELITAQLLAGHATGIADHYVMRKPTMVGEVCEAIERVYFG